MMAAILADLELWVLLKLWEARLKLRTSLRQRRRKQTK